MIRKRANLLDGLMPSKVFGSIAKHLLQPTASDKHRSDHSQRAVGFIPTVLTDRKKP
jgi:hypothetical protein